MGVIRVDKNDKNQGIKLHTSQNHPYVLNAHVLTEEVQGWCASKGTVDIQFFKCAAIAKAC